MPNAGAYLVNSERLVSRIQHMRMAIKVSVTKVTAKVLRGIFPDLLSTSSHVRDLALRNGQNLQHVRALNTDIYEACTIDDANRVSHRGLGA
jgi:hypothetical protein